ncbi:MAG: alpha-E domain-containing protein [Pirellulaceae bacterium]
MLSRVAESIYWMSRQVERAENLARFLEVTLHLILDQPESVVDPWEPLVRATGDTEWYKENYDAIDAHSVVNFLAFDLSYHSSMLTCLRAARENAKSVRESLSSEVYEQLNAYYHFVNDASAEQLIDPTSAFFAQVREHALMWTGIIDSTMTHDLRWHFLNVGRLLERADKTSRILDVKYFHLLPTVEDVGSALDDMQWSAVLLAVSGFEPYRREHQVIKVKKVIDFFLFHPYFPRSLHSCVAGVDWSLREIEKKSDTQVLRNAPQQIADLRHRLANTSVEEVIAGGMHEFVDAMQTELNTVSESLHQDYFNSPIPA